MHKLIKERKELQKLHQEILVLKEEVDFALGSMDKLVLYSDYYDDVQAEKEKIIKRLEFATGIKLN